MTREREAALDQQQQQLAEKELQHARAVQSLQDREHEFQQRKAQLERAEGGWGWREGAAVVSGTGDFNDQNGSVNGFLLPKAAGTRDETGSVLIALDQAVSAAEGLCATLREKCVHLSAASVLAAVADAGSCIWMNMESACACERARECESGGG